MGSNKNKNALGILHPARLLATWFGAGCVPKASGTAGSLAALPFAWCIQTYAGNIVLALAAMLVFVLGVVCVSYYIMRNPENSDPGEIVIDEVAGQWLLLSVMPLTWKGYVIGFLLFRFFDVLKPYPVSFADKNIKGGFGVMFDDILAACYPIALFMFAVMLGDLAGTPVNLDAIYNWLQ